MSLNKLLKADPKNISLIVKNANFKTVTISENEYIIRQDSEMTNIYWAEIAQFTLQHTAKNGKNLNLGVYCQTDCFLGEIECLIDEKALFDVIALEPTKLIVIPKEYFLDILVKENGVALWVAKNIATYYQKTMQVSMDRSLYPLKYSVANDIKQRYLNNVYTTNHQFIHKEAQRFSCSERAYNRVVNELIEQDIIMKKGKDLVPIDVDRISEFLDSYEL